MGLITLEETLIGFAIGSALGHRPGRSHRLHALARAFDDAVDRGLADRADHCAGADDRRHPQPVQRHRNRAESRDRGLSLVLSGDRRHGQGLPLARSAAARSHAHLFRDARADLHETQSARQRAVLLRQHEDRRRRRARRRRGRGSHQERGRGLGRATAWRAPIMGRRCRSGRPCSPPLRSPQRSSPRSAARSASRNGEWRSPREPAPPQRIPAPARLRPCRARDLGGGGQAPARAGDHPASALGDRGALRHLHTHARGRFPANDPGRAGGLRHRLAGGISSSRS